MSIEKSKKSEQKQKTEVKKSPLLFYALSKSIAKASFAFFARYIRTDKLKTSTRFPITKVSFVLLSKQKTEVKKSPLLTFYKIFAKPITEVSFAYFLFRRKKAKTEMKTHLCLLIIKFT